MNEAFIEEQKERLLTLRQEDRDTLQRLQAQMQQGMAETEVKELEEMAAVNTQHKIEMAESNLLQMRLDDIDHALDAIAQGTYGTCERCGKTIAQERLEAVPAARYCLPCQEQVDAEQ